MCSIDEYSIIHLWVTEGNYITILLILFAVQLHKIKLLGNEKWKYEN